MRATFRPHWPVLVAFQVISETIPGLAWTHLTANPEVSRRQKWKWEDSDGLGRIAISIVWPFVAAKRYQSSPSVKARIPRQWESFSIGTAVGSVFPASPPEKQSFSVCMEKL